MAKQPQQHQQHTEQKQSRKVREKNNKSTSQKPKRKAIVIDKSITQLAAHAQLKLVGNAAVGNV